jgi:hypothetical protein
LLVAKQLEVKKLKTTINGLHEVVASTPSYRDEDPIVAAAASARIRPRPDSPDHDTCFGLEREQRCSS